MKIMLSLAASPTPSKQQHAAHRADNEKEKRIKKAHDTKMKKEKSLQKLQTQLRKMVRPPDPKKASAWNERRHALMAKIVEKRDSIRNSDERVSKLRAT